MNNTSTATHEVTITKPDRVQYPLYREIATACGAMRRCEASGKDYAQVWQERIDGTLTNMLPSGSGIDCGTKIDTDASGDDKIVLTFSYHHMNDNGMYDGWTEHKVIVTPSFRGFDLKITGPNRNDIKDYLHETFSYSLEQMVAI